MPESQSATHPDAPIVIAGAGPVGLFVAVLLVEAGRRVIVLEKNEGLAADMRASTFHPATLDLLEEEGLTEPLLARGSIAQAWQYMIHGTKKHAIFDLDMISDETGHPYRLQCEQFHFTNLAVEKLIASPLFEVRFSHEVVDVPEVNGRVRLRVRQGSDEYDLETPWLIAADGGRSAVRKLLGQNFEGSVFPKTSITLVLDYPFQEDVPGLLGVNYVWTDSGHYSLMQIRDLWRFSYSPDPGQTVREAVSATVAQSHVQAIFPRARPYTLLQRNYYTLSQRCMDSFRLGHVLFAGDAAHLSSPAGGMGMNGGIHDAKCLVDHLLPVLRGESESLLDRYSRRRRTIALDEVQRLSARNYRWHRETEPDERAQIWKELQDIVHNPDKAREFLLNSSMIRSRQRELEID